MLAPSHIVLLSLVVLLALVVFGPKRLPELGQGVGRAIQEFKHASSQAAHEFNTTSTELKSAVSLNPTVTSEMTTAMASANGTLPVTAPASDESPAN